MLHVPFRVELSTVRRGSTSLSSCMPSTKLTANSPGHSIRTARGKPFQPCLWPFWWIFLFVAGECGVVAQPPENLNPDDTEAIIAAFLNDATAQQWGDEEVNLEHILQQDAADQAGEASIRKLYRSRPRSTVPTRRSPHQPNGTKRRKRKSIRTTMWWKRTLQASIPPYRHRRGNKPPRGRPRPYTPQRRPPQHG